MAENSDSVVSNIGKSSKELNNDQNADSSKENKLQNAMEPLFLDDFENDVYPQSVENMLKYLEETQSAPNRNDVLISLINILMLELGFVHEEEKSLSSDGSFCYRKHLERTKKLPPNWKTDENYKISYYLPNNPEHECMLFFYASVDDLLINCFIRGVKNGLLAVYLDTLSYFTSSNMDICKLRLQNLKHLSYRIKEDLCYPAKQLILRHKKILQHSMDALPDEMILHIIKYLSENDQLSFGMTALRYNSIISCSFRRKTQIDAYHDCGYKKHKKKHNCPLMIQLC